MTVINVLDYWGDGRTVLRGHGAGDTERGAVCAGSPVHPGGREYLHPHVLSAGDFPSGTAPLHEGIQEWPIHHTSLLHI